MEAPSLTAELAARIERALNLGAESRIGSVGLLPGNPLGVERRQWERVSATLVRRDVLYYGYFNAIRGAGKGEEAHLDQAAAWLRSNGKHCGVSISPFDADESLLHHLAECGLRQSRFMTVLYGVPAPRQTEGQAAAVEEVDSASDLFLGLWLEGAPEADRAFFRTLGQAEFEDWRCYVAFVDSRPAAHACLYMREGVGVLASAWTSTQARGRGCQTALLLRRIADAAEAGCDLVVSQCVPGSQSQRNLERAGLRTAYTQAIWEDTRPA